MRGALVDGNLVEISRQILGSDDIWYAGDSSFTINSGQRGFHKDNADRRDPKAPDWQGRYTILRFGIYLQDHWTHTGGVNLRAKSHTTTDHAFGKNVYVRTRVGDVAVWSLRTTHSGNGVLLKFPHWVSPEPKQIPKIPKWAIAKPDGDRLAVFAALGLNDAHHDRYIEYLKTRTYMVNSFRAAYAHYDDDVLAEAAKAGLNVRIVGKELEGDESAGKNADWEPIPYQTVAWITAGAVRTGGGRFVDGVKLRRRPPWTTPPPCRAAAGRSWRRSAR
jgi:hypothetical protein